MKIDPRILDEIRDKITLSDIVGRKVSLKKAGKEWRGLSPFNMEKSPSFYVNDVKQFFHCFSSGTHGDIFGWFMRTEGLSFPEAIERAGQLAGVDVPKAGPARIKSPQEIEAERRRMEEIERKNASRRRAAAIDEQRRIDTAAGIWKGTVALRGSPGERYFEARGVDPARLDWDALRFAPRLQHPDGEWLPAIVAKCVDVAGQGRGVWRIFLKSDCSGKAYSKPDKRSSKLGKGVAAGCAARLGGVAALIGVCEGVETACGVRELQDYRFPVWPLLSTSGFSTFVPPPEVHTILIYQDSDFWKERDDGTWRPPAGQTAARTLYERLKGSHQVQIQPKPAPGKDYLDILYEQKHGRPRG